MIFHIMNDGDLYEITTVGLCINRIVRYVDGQPIRAELDYLSLPQNVREKVLDKIEQLWKEGNV